MTRYVSLIAIETEAAAASGQPYDAGSVTATGAGTYQICYPQGSGCRTFTTFRADAAGRITGMSVDGQPVAARLAAGPRDTGNGLVLTDVTSYLFTDSGTVGIAFHVRNVSNHGVSNCGYLPVFVTSGGTRLKPDISNSSDTTSPLRPGESAAALVVFDTRTFTGTFTLQSNGGYQDLVSSRLRKPAA